MADVQHRSLHVHAILQAYTASKDLTIRFDLYCDLKFILRSTSIKANFWRNTLSQQRLHLCIVLSAMELVLHRPNGETTETSATLKSLYG